MSTRHVDDGTSIHDFADRFLVRCPKCRGYGDGNANRVAYANRIRVRLDSAVARAVRRKTGRLVNGRIEIQLTGCLVTSSGCRRHVVAKRFGRTTCLT